MGHDSWGAGPLTFYKRRADHASGLVLRAVTASGSEPEARSAIVTRSRTVRKLARTATQTCCRASEGGG